MKIKRKKNKDLKFNLSDSLKLVESSNSYQKKVDILMNIGIRYEWSKGDSAIIYWTTISYRLTGGTKSLFRVIALSLFISNNSNSGR